MARAAPPAAEEEAADAGAVVPPHEVPRLTIVLRHLLTDGGALDLDPDREFLARRAALAARRRRQQEQQGGGGASPDRPVASASAIADTPLSLELVGPDWRRKAPRQAREDYERFLAACGALLGGGPLPPEAVGEAAEAAWRALERALPGDALPAPDRLSSGPGHPPGAARAAVGKVRDALIEGGELGRGLDEAAVPEVARLASALRRWRAEIGSAGRGKRPAAAAAAAGAGGGGAGGAAGAAAANQASEAASASASAASEYGARLSIRPPWRAREAAAEDAGGWWWRPGAGAAAAAAAAGAAFAAAAASQAPAAPSALLAQALGGLGLAAGDAADAPRRRSTQDQRGDDDVDIDSDDERRGRGKAVGLLWLERWAKSVTGADQGGALALAVCTALAQAQHAGGGGGGGDDGDALAAQLLDILGDSAFEKVAEVMERRRELQAALDKAAARVRADRAAARQFEDEEDEAAAAAAAAMPSYGTAVSIQSESQRQMAKLERKAARRKGGGGGGASGGGPGGGAAAAAAADEAVRWLQGVGFEALADTERPRRDGEWFMFNSLMGDGAGAQRSALPQGSKRK
jgi:hypothetical protein